MGSCTVLKLCRNNYSFCTNVADDSTMYLFYVCFRKDRLEPYHRMVWGGRDLSRSNPSLNEQGHLQQVCKIKRWRDISKTDVPERRRRRVQMLSMDFNCEEVEEAVLWRAVVWRQ